MNQAEIEKVIDGYMRKILGSAETRKESELMEAHCFHLMTLKKFFAAKFQEMDLKCCKGELSEDAGTV